MPFFLYCDFTIFQPRALCLSSNLAQFWRRVAWPSPRLWCCHSSNDSQTSLWVRLAFLAFENCHNSGNMPRDYPTPVKKEQSKQPIHCARRGLDMYNHCARTCYSHRIITRCRFTNWLIRCQRGAEASIFLAPI